MSDLPLLAEHFLKLYCGTADKEVGGISGEAMAQLAGHSWPGNVRELQNVIERAVALTTSDRVGPEDLPDDLGREGPQAIGHHQHHLPFKDAKEVVIQEFEQAYIENLLANHGGNITRAAEESGIDRRSLHRLLAKHGIDASAYTQ